VTDGASLTDYLPLFAFSRLNAIVLDVLSSFNHSIRMKGFEGKVVMNERKTLLTKIKIW
jgi:hypothetical protein